MEKAQCQARQEALVADTQQATGGTVSKGDRNEVAGRIWSPAIQFDLPPSVAHSAVSLFDRALCFTMPAYKTMLLAACCLFIESYSSVGYITRLFISQVRSITST